MDALALYHEFSAKGIVINEPFVGNNMWVVNFKDPDGYTLDFESPTDVLEETKYSEWAKMPRRFTSRRKDVCPHVSIGYPLQG